MKNTTTFGRLTFGQRNKSNLKKILPAFGICLAMAGGQAYAETLTIMSEDKSVQITGKLIAVDSERLVVKSGLDMIEFDARTVSCVDGVCTINAG